MVMSDDTPEEIERVRKSEASSRRVKYIDEAKAAANRSQKRTRLEQCYHLLRGPEGKLVEALRKAGIKPGTPQFDEYLSLRKRVIFEEAEQHLDKLLQQPPQKP